MKKSIFCLALAAATAAPMTISAQATDTDKNEINQCQTNRQTMFSNIDLTDEQKQLLSTIENPFAEDFMVYNTEKSRATMAAGELPERCGGDPRFQSGDGEFDPILQERHQQLIDARVKYLQRLSELLTPGQYDQFIRNLDSVGRVE